MVKEKIVIPPKFLRQVQPYLDILDRRVSSPEQAAERLKSYHAIGQLVLELDPTRPQYGDGKFEQLADELGRGTPWIYATTRFALTFNKRELGQLCKHAGSLHWGHIILLLPIKNKNRRLEFQRRAAREGWPPVVLRERIRSKIAKRNKGGRPLRVAMDPQIRLEQLISVSRASLSYQQQLLADEGATLTDLGKLPAAKLTNRLDKELAGAQKILKELEKSCHATAAQLRRAQRLIRQKKSP